jgi:hypothetical protein
MFKYMMKTMFLGSLILLSLSCEENSTNPENQSPVSFLSQSSGCLSNGLPKANGLDSIFTYSFSGGLILDFSVVANCCPDSNRFSVSHIAGTDTLIIAVADTAQSFCHCVCLYMTHAEFMNLPNDHYVVRCTIENSSGQGETIHLVHVDRQQPFKK